jgi:hypothetical protein
MAVDDAMWEAAKDANHGQVATCGNNHRHQKPG